MVNVKKTTVKDKLSDWTGWLTVAEVSWFNGNWSFPAFELTYSGGGKQHEEKTKELYI
jgi:hypothetical protein